MRGDHKYGKKTRSRGAWDAQRGPAVIRDRTIGQSRGQSKPAVESPDQQDRFHHLEAVPIAPRQVRRATIGTMTVCAGCGRTKDFWAENNGQGLSKSGRRFCCKPCSDGGDCRCASMEAERGPEVGGLVLGQGNGNPNQRKKLGHDPRR
jgi:hypothetical protein